MLICWTLLTTVTLEVGVCEIVETPQHEQAEESSSQEYPLSTECAAKHSVETRGEAPASSPLYGSVVYAADVGGVSRFWKLLPLCRCGNGGCCSGLRAVHCGS